MNSTSQKQSALSSSLSTRRRSTVAPKSRPQLVSLQVDCLYGIDRSNEADDLQDDRPPVLTRFLRCRASLPIEIPLQNTSRVIAMLKCFRKVQPVMRNGATPMIETIFSKFTRVWPRDVDEEETAPRSPTTGALVVHESTSSVEFTVPLAADLPQSIELGSGSIYYTMQIQANLRHPTDITAEAVIYSPEIKVDIPAPEAAYSASRLPKRITNGVMGQAQDHFGILISSDISLHVSVPREILYSRKLHSVFKIHIKLMPHPPEAKLPGIARLEWKLIQKTNLGSVQIERNAQGNKRIGVSTAELASGQILLPTQKSGSQGGEEAMSGSRKDQYLYIALPENSPALLPMYDGNKYLEILHYLDIELFPTQESGRGNNYFAKSAASFFSKTFSRSKKDSSQSSSSTTSSSGGGGGGSRLPWKASVPIRLYFDTAEIPRKSSISNTSDGKGKLQRLAITS